MNKVRTIVLTGAALLALGVGLGSCSGTPPVGYVPVTGEGASLSDFPLAIDVQNHRGSVLIRVDPDVHQPTVIAVAEGVSGMATHAEWAAASLALDEGRPVLRVLSMPGAEGGADTPVEIRITVPSCGGVRVVNNDGPVMLKGVGGAIEVQNSLSARGGDAIVLETTRGLTDPVLLVADMGNVRVNVGPASQCSLIASAPEGTVIVDGGNAAVWNAKYEKRVWTGTVNAGTSEFRITANSGDVMFRIVW